MKRKKIYFCIDDEALARHYDKGYCPRSYMSTIEHIRQDLSPIVTTSMSPLSFWLTISHDLALCYQDKVIEINDGVLYQDGTLMNLPLYSESLIGKDLYEMFICGVFDKFLGIENGRNRIK